MKYEILKRTAIALFVGSVISTYSVAEGSISTKSSVEEVTNAINKNSENISGVKKAVSDLANTLLKGDSQNPSLLDALGEANKGINENKEALALKADKALADELDKDLGNLEGKVSGLEDKVSVLVDKAANKEDLGKLNGAVETLSADLASLNTTTNELADGVKGNSEDIQDLSKGIKEGVLPAIEANREDIDNNTKEIEKIKNLTGYDSLTKVENKVKELVSKKADNQALEDLKKEVKDNEEGIGELSGIVNELGEDVGDLTEGHRDLEVKHNDLVKDVKAFNDAYNKFTDATNTELDKKADIDDVEDALSRKANASDVYTKTESDSKLDVKADKTELANKADKNSVYSKSETDNKFALKADNSVVSAQAADISNLRTDVNAHTKRLDHLDNRVNKLDKDLKRGLAAQAALTGLFQPYTVGKANFTAAVGGYKSQTAVAIGTGYRYNQNIATKAGVAFTQGGGVTYNAGVNFEW